MTGIPSNPPSPSNIDPFEASRTRPDHEATDVGSVFIPPTSATHLPSKAHMRPSEGSDKQKVLKKASQALAGSLPPGSEDKLPLVQAQILSELPNNPQR